MVTFVMFKWYESLHYKGIPAIYWMTLVSEYDQEILQSHIADKPTAS